MTTSTLYVLDDDEQYANLLTELAKNAGWNAVAEQSPLAFLENDLSKIDVLVLDLNMPEMDGIEIIRSIAEHKYLLTLVLVSGFDARVLHSAQQLAEAHNIEVAASLTKPVSINEFIKVLDDIEINTQIPKNQVEKESVTVAELQRAISNDELILFYQPQIDIKTEELSGVEALVRWLHPERGMIFPDQFISLAEENNLIDELTERVIYLAITQNKKWLDKGLNITISVNVSADNIIGLNLPEQLKKLTEQHDVEAEKSC